MVERLWTEQLDMINGQRVTEIAAAYRAGHKLGTVVPRASLITARGLAPLPKLLGLAAPLLAPGGQCLFLKSANVQTELTHAAAQWHMQVERIPSRTAPDACILRISDLHRVVPTA
jgi:16S rRNA (guanine527-N7)-methyltransferase